VSDIPTNTKDEKARAYRLIVIVVIVVIVIAVIANAKKNSPSTTGGQSPTTTAAAGGATSLPKFDTLVKDGDFSFRPSHLVCNIMSVGSNSNFDLTTPTGQYCRATIFIYNHSTTSQTIDVTSQYAVDNKGRQYPGDTNADSPGNPNLTSGLGGLDLMTLNPGLSVTGYLYFDMPKNDMPVYFIFHDSAFSNGVKEQA
jgi:hypothetical protein